MSDGARSGDSTAKAVGGILLAIVVINVLPRVVGMPDLELPSISLPELPAWADTGADVIHTIVKVKNWVIGGVVALVVVGVALEQYAKHRGS